MSPGALIQLAVRAPPRVLHSTPSVTFLKNQKVYFQVFKIHVDFLV
jgi:hypothetical protein